MRTTKLFFTVLLIVSIRNFSYSQNYSWVALNPTSISGTPDFSGLYFTDDTTGWITTSSMSSNNVFKTTDGGTAFMPQTTSKTLSAIHMKNSIEGYCGGAGGIVFRTTNGGDTWSILGTITNSISDISFTPDGDTGYATGLNGALWRVTSAGVTNLNSGLSLGLNAISAPSVNNVWVCGGTRIYYYNGAILTEQPAPTGTYNAIYFINSLEGWVVGDGGIIAHTTDGGNNWTVQSISGSGPSLFDVFFLNSNEGWAVGVNGTILHTTNGGAKWNMEGSGLSTAFLRRVHFTSPGNGYVVGNKKTLLKYSHLTGHKQIKKTRIINIHPNPTDGIIKLDIQSNQHLESMVISDMSGREVFQKSNLFSNEIDLRFLPGGYYLLQIITGSQVYYGKIIIQF